MRASWSDYFLEMSLLVATRSTCPRRQVGAVLVRDQRVIATGYNGAPHGQPHCTEVGCLMENGHCVRTIHAELNALLQCARYGIATQGVDLYCTDMPCRYCARALVQAGVERIFYLRPYESPETEQLTAERGLQLIQLDRPARP
ncbi:deoxycytidylate deaminase [Sulfobacillus harzensis]|uniref:dCMP deaminase family protein n=1 Tax=Sulfobacillus harzensis TaxID=2729629 RepID=A0A7Y0Q3W0_9FIRM|nr:dCMP deaminase family protein [Sulfobacillus harzensis]NMP22594.1 dCMP deaminase family protein [Sulfobacillus harzensis]